MIPGYLSLWKPLTFLGTWSVLFSKITLISEVTVIFFLLFIKIHLLSLSAIVNIYNFNSSWAATMTEEGINHLVLNWPWIERKLLLISLYYNSYTGRLVHKRRQNIDIFIYFCQPTETKWMIKVGYHGKGTAVARIELQTTQAPGDCADHLTITNPMFIASQWKISSWNFQVLIFDSKRKNVQCILSANSSNQDEKKSCLE